MDDEPPRTAQIDQVLKGGGIGKPACQAHQKREARREVAAVAVQKRLPVIGAEVGVPGLPVQPDEVAVVVPHG